MNVIKYPELYILDTLIEKRPELVDMSINAQVRAIILESA